MSIFSKIRGAKKAADKHKAAVKPIDTKVISKYRHVPTHAAIDALSGAPATWKTEDRAAIKAAHQGRMSLNRTLSTLSQTTYAANNTSVIRNSSFLSQEAATVTSSNQRPRLEAKKSHMGYPLGSDDWAHPNPRSSRQIGKSPLASHQISPAESSTSSRSSSSSPEGLEMPIPQPMSAVYTPNALDSYPRNTTRRLGEAPVQPQAPARAVSTNTPTINMQASVNSRNSTPNPRKWHFRHSKGPQPNTMDSTNNMISAH